MIIANDVSDQRIGFNSDENSVTVLTHDDTIQFAQCAKEQLATQLISTISEHYKAQS